MGDRRERPSIIFFEPNWQKCVSCCSIKSYLHGSDFPAHAAHSLLPSPGILQQQRRERELRRQQEREQRRREQEEKRRIEEMERRRKEEEERRRAEEEKRRNDREQVTEQACWITEFSSCLVLILGILGCHVL